MIAQPEGCTARVMQMRSITARRRGWSQRVLPEGQGNDLQALKISAPGAAPPGSQDVVPAHPHLCSRELAMSIQVPLNG